MYCIICTEKLTGDMCGVFGPFTTENHADEWLLHQDIGDNHTWLISDMTCPSNHRYLLELGEWTEKAGGTLHCDTCGEQIGQFRQ